MAIERRQKLEAIPYPDPQRLIEAGGELLDELRRRNVILGTRR